MNILILSGSARKNGNSERLAEAFAKGAISIGHIVKKHNANDLKINPCLGCRACGTAGRCINFPDDDMQLIYNDLTWADMIVFATPLYWCSFPGQLKTLIDRTIPYTSPFNVKYKDMHIKKAALLSVAEAESEEIFNSINLIYNDMCGYLSWEDAGKLQIPRLRNVGDIENTDALSRAFTFGSSL